MRHHWTLALVPFLATAASAQTALLREGDPSPDGAFGQNVSGLRSVEVNAGSGYATVVSTNGLSGTDSFIWGSLTPAGPSSVLRAPGVVGPATQTSFDNDFGLSSQGVAYSANIDVSGGSSGLDSAWFEDSAVVIEGQSVAGRPELIRDVLFTDVTEAGTPTFYGRAGLPTGGTPTYGGVFIGSVPVLATSTTLTNATGRVAGVSFEYAVSPGGTQVIAPVVLDFAAPGTERALVIVNAVVSIGGDLVREGTPVPASLGEPGDVWESVREVAINDAGKYAAVMRVDTANGAEQMLLLNGEELIRSSSAIDGYHLGGSFDDVVINARGQVAYRAELFDPVTFASGQALFLDGRAVLLQGDLLDWDGDGQLDPQAFVTNIGDEDEFKLADDGTIYVLVRASVFGATLEALVRVDTGDVIAETYCAVNPNTSGQPARIRAFGTSQVAANDLTIVCQDMPANQFGLLVVSATRGFIANPGGSQGNLCVGGDIGRFISQVTSSGPGGEISIPVDLTALPQPSALVQVAPGEGYVFQMWFRDQPAPGFTGSNFSNAVQVTFE